MYKQMKEQGKLSAQFADWPTKRRWVARGFSKLEKKGYSITSTCTAVKNPDQTKFQYRDQLWGGADMVALGVASFGHLGGIHYQNVTHFEGLLLHCRAINSRINLSSSTEEELGVSGIYALQWSNNPQNE